MPTIHWFRRDLRLADNQALHMAAHEGDGQVIPLFVVDPILVQSARVGANRLAWLAQRLQTLHAELHALGSGLHVAYGDPETIIQKLCQQYAVTSVHWQRDTAPWAQRRDTAVGLMLRNINVRSVMHDTLTIVPAQQVLTDKGTPYTVFTPYYRRWRTQLNLGDALPVPTLAPVPTQLATGQFPSWSASAIPIPDTSRQQALNLLNHFASNRINDYAEQRNYPAVSGSAQLSAYLRFGVLSAQECARVALAHLTHEPKSGTEVWLSQLAWRDFYQQILFHFPHVAQGAFRPIYDNIAWPNDERLFAAWCTGQTGYPIVDAAMRQLVQTGWMHNRARMIVASFLTKDLLVDWRWGERFFMQHLVDGDTAANNGGWQWAAGTGTDAQPYFRIFNPMSQGEKFDSDGAYVRHYCPELANVPHKYIHAPWTMPPLLMHEVGCVVGHDYPAPIVDHSVQRGHALQLYKDAVATDPPHDA